MDKRSLFKNTGLAFALLAGTMAFVTGIPARAQEGTLKIYSSSPDQFLRPLIGAFNKIHPNITVEVSVQPGEELVSTIELEMRANSPHADIALLNEASINGLQSRHKTWEAYKPADFSAVHEEVRDPANIVIPACINPYLIQYNTNKVKAGDAPKSWLDLLDAKWNGKIAMADPVKSQSIQSFIWFIATELPKRGVAGFGWQYFEKLKGNDVRLEGSHGTIRDLTASGERPIGIQLLANGQTSANRGDPTAIVWPKEGSPGELTAFAMFAGSNNKPAAKAWLDFVVSKEGQSLMPNALGCAPIRDDVDYMFPGGTAVADVKIVPVNSAFIIENRKKHTADFNKAMGR
ncbi:extracellular solute-binding protein [Shumkonia mesophila]|uniref:extracellular solute-binding protein n=1 Tax=Shumkonia mesophila TaxID=2838854 RepID=UPI002934AFDB|nr:extracellular solute-binding protein [Shumkonia mesophila]